MCGGCVIFPSEVITPERAAAMEADARARTLAELEGIDDRAKDAAFSLYTLATFSVNRDVLSAVATGLFEVASLIPAIRALLRVDYPSPVVTSEHNTLLFQYVFEIRALLDTVDKKIEATGGWILPVPREPDGGFYPIHDLQKAETILGACSSTFFVIITAARQKGLEDVDTLSTYQTLEKARLCAALAQPGFKITPLPLTFPPPSASPLQPTRSSSSTLAPRHYEPSVPDFKLASVALVNEAASPPTSPTTASGTPIMTPVTTRDGTPAAGNEVTSSSNLPEGPDQKTSAPSAVPVQDDAPKFEDTASTEPTTTLNLDDLSNLHMYLLRASIQPGNATNHILHLAHQINRVPVPRSEIISRLQKLSPDYSVAKALEELNPEEFRLVVEHANGLNGTIVSVQRTEDVERITQMGTLKLRSFCFFMTTPERLQLEQKRAPLQQERPSINYPSVSQTAFTTHGAERRESPEGRGIFSNPDFVPHQEKDYAGVAKFETITSDPNYGNYSLEELRLRDYQAGRNQSTTREAGPTTKRPNFGDSGPAPNFTRSWKKLLADKSQPSARGRSLFDPPETARDQPKSLFGHFGPAPKANNPSTTDSISGSNAPQGSSLFPGTASNVTKDTPTAVGWFLASKATKTSPFDGFGSKDNTTKTPVGFWGECAQCSTLPCRCSWSGSGTACGRSDGVSGRQNKPSRGLFGSNPEIATMHSGGLFGGQQSKPFGSIFGSTPATQTSSAGGLFGGFGGPQNKPSGGLFGSNPGTQTSTHTGLFGGNPSQPQASNPFANSAPPIFARGFGSQPGPVKPDPGNPIRKTFGTGKHGEQISDDVNQRMEQMRKDIEQMKLKMAIKQASPKEESSKETQSRSQDNSPKESNKSENEEAEQSALYGPVSPPFDEDDL